jgi:hypothetical protein
MKNKLYEQKYSLQKHFSKVSAEPVLLAVEQWL